MTVHNYLPHQYEVTNRLEINHNYLNQQFADHDEILAKIREVVIRGDFTLGKEVDLLEEEFAALCGARHAIGVGSGTDAIFLTLKAMGVGKGDEVITTPFTFYATVGAIVTAGATPVFVDIKDDYNIDVGKIERCMTRKTKAILPVHWSGKPCDMTALNTLARKHRIPVVADACHAVNSTYKGRPTGSLAFASCFSFHPLKNLNVWGDGGIVVTNSSTLAKKLRLIRNHGLADRDTCKVFSYNSRLDTLQAVVARHLLAKVNHITASRIANADYLDAKLASIRQVSVPARDPKSRQVYHIYSVCCERRDRLVRHLVDHGIDAKVHYPVPMHLQPAASVFGYKPGDFPIAERIANTTVSLPVHEFITTEQLDYMAGCIESFYA